MPAQTTKKTHIFFPDGCQVAVKRPGDGSYFDVGAINSAVNAVLNWDENEVETANAGKLAKQIRNMTIAADFTLINLDPDGVNRMSAGLITKEDVAGASTPAEDQVIPIGGWVDKGLVHLEPRDSAGNLLKPASGSLTVTSVTGSTSGAGVAGSDFNLVKDANSPSGWSIQLLTGGGKTFDPATETVTVVYPSITPVASSVLSIGASTFVMTAFAVLFKHTDDNGKVRQLEMFAAEPNSGGFAFGFKGANEDGVEEMPLSLTGKIDTSRTSGKQLMAWTVESGAM